MPKSRRSAAAVMRPAATIAVGATARRSPSRSARWIVTGTTRSSGQASIITGRGAARQLGEELGVAGMAEAGGVERLLLDRVGDERRGAAGADQRDAGADRRDHRRRVGRVRPARPPPVRAARPAAPAAPAETSPPPSSGAAIGSQRHRPAKRGGERARAGRDRRSRRRAAAPRRGGAARPAASISPPIPAGSPMVSASGAIIRGRPR